jgi:hypothetical protein
MRFVEPSTFADPDVAARKLVEIAHTAEAVQDSRVHIELINERFLEAGVRPPSTALVSTARSPGLAMAARIRRLCEVHPGRGRAVRLIEVVASANAQ